MRPALRRFGEEFFLYSSQFVAFFIFILFVVPGPGSPGILAAIILGLFLVSQTLLLAGSGHKIVLRFLYSLITPFGYSLIQWVSGNFELTEMATVILWGSALYSGIFQAAALSIRNTTIKRGAEAFLALGSPILFVFFYYYITIKIEVGKALASGLMGRIELQKALDIRSFPHSFLAFIQAPGHWFPIFAAVTFSFMLLSSKQRIISLRAGIERLFGKAGEAIDDQRFWGDAASRDEVHGSGCQDGSSAQPAPAAPPAEAPKDAGTEPARGGADTMSDSDRTQPVQDSHALHTKASASGDTGARRRAATIVASSIRGFNELAERLGPDGAAGLLHRYYSIWDLVATCRSGRIVSMIGDAVILIFGPDEEDAGAEGAFAATLAFLEGIADFKQDLAASGYPATYEVTIGIHTGTIVTAVFASDRMRRQAAFGEAIAVATRLDSFCRELKQDLIVSQTSFSRLGLESQSRLERMGEVLLSMSTHPVPVYGRKQKYL